MKSRAWMAVVSAFSTLATVGAGQGQTLAEQKAVRPLIDYFKPIPIVGQLSKEAWGADNVLPRDASNGLEDTSIKKYCYWDGQIIKAADGKFHMFASRWNQDQGHNGWGGSVAVHSVSNNVIGPYVETGLCWPQDQAGKGHNVTALVLPDGTYAVVISETRPGTVYTSKSLDGPWTELGEIKVDAPAPPPPQAPPPAATQPGTQPNGRGAARGGRGRGGWRASNYSVMARPDGGFEIVPRSGQILISTTGILGPYKITGPSVYSKVPEMSGFKTLEDPVVWYSGGFYHIVVNDWGPRKAYHLVSRDGVTDWKFAGLAYDPTTEFVKYSDGTVNHWNNMERPGVLIENGHVTHFTLAVIDVPKAQERPNDNHGSKVIVIPFDGEALDRDLNAAFPEKK